jgi:xanthine dehydrogenase accessory factor
MKAAFLQAMNAERAARRACVLVTDLAQGAQRLVLSAGIAADPLHQELETALRMGKSGMIDHETGRYFLTVQAPPLRIVVVGAVHVSQALASMAHLLGHRVIVVDPRTAFASKERFPDADLLAQWPDEALPVVGIDRYTAFVALTHDPKIDDPGLVAALKSDCFYIGALGSRKTHAKRLERLGSAGFAAEHLARIHAPIGLDIGAVSPAEIALSIMAEITAAQRKKPERLAGS